MSNLRAVLDIMGNTEFVVRNGQGDNDEIYRLQKQKEEDELFARMDAYDDLFSLFGSSWEFEGAMAGTAKSESTYTGTSVGGHYPQITMGHFTTKLKFVYGTQHLRLMMAPLSFSWTNMPSYTRYDEDDEMIDMDNLGSIFSYSPEIGLQYAFFPKKQRDNPYRELEILMSANYAVLFPLKASNLKEPQSVFDSELTRYLPSYNDVISGSIEINIFPSKGFGYGLVAGLRKVRIHGTEDSLSETYGDRNRRFRLEFDDLKSLLPYYGGKIIIRMY